MNAGEVIIQHAVYEKDRREVDVHGSGIEHRQRHCHVDNGSGLRQKLSGDKPDRLVQIIQVFLTFWKVPRY